MNTFSELYDISKMEHPNGIIHLRISRKDKQPIHDWEDLQNIKNDYIGINKCAIEVYPPESSVVNYSNTYHLFHLPEFNFPDNNTGNYISNSYVIK